MTYEEARQRLGSNIIQFAIEAEYKDAVQRTDDHAVKWKACGRPLSGDEYFILASSILVDILKAKQSKVIIPLIEVEEDLLRDI